MGRAARIVGLTALVASVLYFASDVIEAIQGGFTAGQLWLTFIAEAAVPVFVLGLAAVQRPRLGRLGRISAVAYAYSYLVFTGTVVYALANGTKNYDTLSHELTALMLVHGAVMVLAGLGFGYAALRAGLLPAWSALAVMAGVVLVALAQRTPAGVQLIAAGVRDVGFSGMGAALLRTRATRSRAVDRAPTGRLTAKTAEAVPGVYLYWLPLGACAHVVRISGRAYEALSARFQRRPRRDLYHSALEVVTTDGRFVIEMTPISDRLPRQRGVVAHGAVGSKWARSLPVFRYEIWRWRDGEISDRSAAIASPIRVADDDVAQQVLDLVPLVPTPVWGRDELHAGEMWNSNSVTSWLLASAGVNLGVVQPPPNGRAPGWDAGRVVARRMARTSTPRTLKPRALAQR